VTDDTLYQTVTFIAFVLFSIAVFVGATSTLVRAIRYTHAGQAWPRLLIRDLLMVGGLGVVLALILGARALGLGAFLVGNVPWAVFTGVIAVASVAAYDFYELFIIEKGSRDKRGEDPSDVPPQERSEPRDNDG
jgi:hypothetical protein